MTKDLAQLVETLSLSKVGEGEYVGNNVPFTRHHIFGGQILAQALKAAINEVPADRFVHSSHAYFLSLGDRNQEVRFEVEKVRDGRTFNSRRVVVKQKEKVIFETLISFQQKEDGMQYQEPMKDVTGPETFVDEMERWNNHPLVQANPEKKITFSPVEIRHSGPMDWFDAKPQSPNTGIWMRTRGALPDDPNLHKVILAYFSDTMLYGAALRPHGLSFHSHDLQGASLDHAIWFHDEFRADEWLFYQQDGIWSGSARGLNHGKFYTQDGRHIASATQEGLMRLKK